jgi:hypothetical protein
MLSIFFDGLAPPLLLVWRHVCKCPSIPSTKYVAWGALSHAIKSVSFSPDPQSQRKRAIGSQTESDRESDRKRERKKTERRYVGTILKGFSDAG